jgi:hypothetical protein
MTGNAGHIAPALIETWVLRQPGFQGQGDACGRGQAGSDAIIGGQAFNAGGSRCT